jgi:hypothetical protein
MCLEVKLSKATRQRLSIPLGYRRSSRYTWNAGQGWWTGKLASRGCRNWRGSGGHAVAVTVIGQQARFQLLTYSYLSTSVVV